MINNLYIKNFKSIKELECSLPQFTAIVGRNAAGKTNILQAIGVLKELVAGDQVDVVIGKITLLLAEILNKDSSDKMFNIKIELTDKEEKLYFLEVVLKLINGTAPANFIVDHEKLTVKKHDSEKVIIYERKDNQIEDGTGAKILITVDAKKLFVALFTNDEAQAVRDLFQNIVIPDSQLMDARESTAGITEENLTGLLIRLRHNEPQLYSEFEKVRGKLLPAFANITELASSSDKSNSLTQEEQYLVLFEEKHLRGQLSLKLLSAGDVRTLYIIAIAICMRDNSTLIFEEIENGIHQQRIEEIVNYLESISRVRNSQIIFTTHSEKVINRLALQEVLYIEKDPAKGTRIIPLDDHKELSHIHEILNKGGSLNDYLNITFGK